jgi:hypothetical protein
MDINKIIGIIRTLKEEGTPTMSTGSTASKAGFGGSSQGFDPGPTAGYDKVMGLVRRKKIIGLGKGSRNRWKKPQ